MLAVLDAQARPAVGIGAYGVAIPGARIGIAELGRQWELSERHQRLFELNGRSRFAVPEADEDTTSLAIEAADAALRLRAEGAPRVGGVLVGSESHTYAVKPTAGTVAEALGLTPACFAADMQFACKGGTAALLACVGLVAGGLAGGALAIGADVPQSAPGSLLEASVGAAAVALAVQAEAPVAVIEAVASCSSDTADFWRRDTEQFPRVAGKFSAEMGYMQHSRQAVRAVLERRGLAPQDIRFACFHQPYAALPLRLARELGFKRAQVQLSLASSRIGNAYSAATLLALCAALDAAQPGDLLLAASYGSGAGSDAFVLRATKHLPALHARRASLGLPTVAEQLAAATRELSYGQYVARQGKLRRP